MAGHRRRRKAHSTATAAHIDRVVQSPDRKHRKVVVDAKVSRGAALLADAAHEEELALARENESRRQEGAV